MTVKEAILFPKNPNFLPGSSNIEYDPSVLKEMASVLMNYSIFMLSKEIQYHVIFTKIPIFFSLGLFI